MSLEVWTGPLAAITLNFFIPRMIPGDPVRSMISRYQGQLNAAKTHCPQNHPYDEENTIFLANGRRRCRICNAAQTAAYRAARAA